MLKEKEQGFLREITGNTDAPEYKDYDEYDDVMEEAALTPDYPVTHKHQFYQGMDD